MNTQGIDLATVINEMQREIDRLTAYTASYEDLRTAMMETAEINASLLEAARAIKSLLDDSSLCISRTRSYRMLENAIARAEGKTVQVPYDRT